MREFLRLTGTRYGESDGGLMDAAFGFSWEMVRHGEKWEAGSATERAEKDALARIIKDCVLRWQMTTPSEIVGVATRIFHNRRRNAA